MGWSWQQGNESALTWLKNKSFCPYNGICSDCNIWSARLAAWSYPETYPEVSSIANMMSFGTDKVSVYHDGGNCTSIQARQWFYTARIANSPSPEWARSSRHNGLTSRERVVGCGDETWLDCYR